MAAPWTVDTDTRDRLEAHLSQRYELEAPMSLTR